MDLVAPSGGTPGDVVTTDRMGDLGYNNTNYTTTFNGTSAACPQVAGVAALMLSVRPDLTETQIRTTLQNTARDLGISGFDNTYGYGLVNAYAAVSAIAPRISGPTTICDQGEYKIENLPSGATVQWSTSNSNLTLVSGQDSLLAIFRKTDDISTIGAIRANITINPATPPIVLKKEIWVNDKLLVNGEDIILKSRFNNPIPGNGSYYSPYQISSNTVYTLIFPFISQDYTVEKVTISEGLPIFFLDLDFPIVSKSVNNEDYSVDIYYFGRCSKQQHTIYFRMNNVNLLSNFSLTPNPATKYVMVSVNTDNIESNNMVSRSTVTVTSNKYNIQLWNSFGLVKQVTTDQNNYQLDLHGIPKGFYYVHVIKDGKTHRKQLIIK